MRRFYSHVHYKLADSLSSSGWQIFLDDAPLATPKRHCAILPTQALAQAVQAEWKAVDKDILLQGMPYTCLSFAALDVDEVMRETLIEHMLAHVDTDAICYTAPQATQNALYSKGQEACAAVLDWCNQRFGWVLHTTDALMPLKQPLSTHRDMRRYLQACDCWQLVALNSYVSDLHSIILAIAMLEGRLSVADAFALAQLEEDAQAEQWGWDEQALIQRNVRADYIEKVAQWYGLVREDAAVQP